MPESEADPWDTPRAWSVSVALLSLLVLALPCAASPAEIDARVVWVRGNQIYLAAPDSIAVRQATTLTFVRGKKTVATGEVARVLDRALALAHVTSGTLGEKHLERVRVLAEPVRAPRKLRVGYPARGRGADPFAACLQGETGAPSPPGTYRLAGSDRNTLLIRLPDAALSSAWPETLLVRQFDDTADQEIALERGELDVGVFWPGELSTHMREHPRWRNRLPASCGVIAAQRYGLTASDDAARAQPLDDSPFHALNQAVFRGDLSELWTRWPNAPPPSGGAKDREGAPAALATRYDVDTQCPGRETLERFFTTSRRGPPRSTYDLALHLFYLPVPTAGPLDILADYSIAEAATDFVRHGPFPALVRARADSMFAEVKFYEEYSNSTVDIIWLISDQLDLHVLFSYDCQVVFDPAVQPSVAAVGAFTLVNLFRCREASR